MEPKPPEKPQDPGDESKKNNNTIIIICVLVGCCFLFIVGGGILAGILVPTIARARSRAQQTLCTSNLRQIGIAASLYQDDHRFYPHDNLAAGPSMKAMGDANPHASFQLLLTGQYVDDPGIFVCPATSDKAIAAKSGGTLGPTSCSYSYRKKPLPSGKIPSTFLIAADEMMGPGQHEFGMNILYATSTVKWFDDDSVTPKMVGELQDQLAPALLINR